MCERRRDDGLNRAGRYLARRDARERELQVRAVDGLGDAFPERLGDERVVHVVATGVQQFGGAQVLYPHRSALAAHLTGDRHRPHRDMPEPRRERGRVEERAAQHIIDSLCPHKSEEFVGPDGALARHPQQDAVVRGRPDGAAPVGELDGVGQRDRPRVVHPDPEARVDHDLRRPVFALEMLHEESSVRGEHAGHGVLLAQVLGDARRAVRVDVSLTAYPVDEVLVVHARLCVGSELPHEAPKMACPRVAVTAPVRNGGRVSVYLLDQDAVLLHLRDRPRRTAQDEHIAGVQLLDEPLVQRADARSSALPVDVVVDDVGDGARTTKGVHARLCVRRERVAHLVPDDLRVRRLASVLPGGTGEQIQHAVEFDARQFAIAVRATQQVVEPLDGPLVRRDRPDDVLREHIEAAFRHADGFEITVEHGAHEHGGLNEVIAVDGKHASLASGIEQVACASDSLQACGHGLWALHLAHEIDTADVDAKLQRRRRDDGVERAVLEVRLHIEAHGLGHAAVVRAYPQGFAHGCLAESQCRPLGLVPAVVEDECRRVVSDHGGHVRVGRAPHRVELRVHEVVHGRHDLDVQRLAAACVDNGARPWAAGVVDSREICRDGLQGVLCRREPYPRERLVAQVAEAFERQGQVHPALVRHQRVDFVDDHIAHHLERVAEPRRGQNDRQRLGRRDEYVRRAFEHLATFVLRRVSRAHL